MEQIQNFINWYFGLFTDPDNKVRLAAWGTTITTITFIIVYVVKPLRQFVIGLFCKDKVVENVTENPVPSVDIFINQDDSLQPIIDDTFNSKINLVKQRYRLGQSDGLKIELIPTFPTDNYDEFRLHTLRLRLEEQVGVIQKKMEILLKTNDFHLANANNLQIAFYSLLQKPPTNVTSKTKLDIYRVYDPKIYFPVYLSDEQMLSIATMNQMTVEQLIGELKIPQLLTTNIFSEEILCTEVLPALVREIYRMYSKNNFDFDITQYWWDVSSYEVGLG